MHFFFSYLIFNLLFEQASNFGFVCRMAGGRGESHANAAEGLATGLQCLEDLQQCREPGATAQKHCILVCNSPPYQLPAVESPNFSGHTAEQLAALLHEVGCKCQ